MKIEEIISLAEDQVEDIKTLPIIIKRSRHVNSIRENVILDEGVLDFLKPYVEKSKDKIASLREAIKRELWETGVMWEIIRKGTRAKDYEIKFANRQFKDMLKSVGLSAWYALPIPGNTLWITMTEKFLNKFGISILPDNVKDAFFGKVKERAVAEDTLNEYRNALYDFVKSKFPTWPEYVLKDFLYAQAKGIRDKEELKDFLDRNQKDYGQVKWRLEKLAITVDIFTPKTQRMIQQREGGSSNPLKVPRDVERHELQAKIIQQKGVSPEPIIVAKLNNGYDLIEGWHRTIQHLKAYPEGYTGPAWVAYGATYTSEDVAENFADGKKPGRRGLAKRMRVPTKASVSRLRQIAKTSSGERARMAHWMANMKAGRKKKSQ
jgi:hypothetical protein